MCRLTDTGHQCLLDWGQWAARDGTMRRLGFPSCSAEQMAGRVVCGDYEVNAVAELVDSLIVGLLEDRKRLVAKFFYVDRMRIADVVVRVDEFFKSRYESGVIKQSERVSVSAVKDDLAVIRSMVGGVALWCDKKSC
jgi:hypothetical protein